MRVNLERTRSQDVDLAILLAGIDAGEVALPEFQRDFVWGVDDVKSLLATVLAGWPMGSMLLMDGRSPVFGLRPFDSSPPDEKGTPLTATEYVVLDGQQRLTALYQAFYGRGKVRYALQFMRLESMSIETLDEAIVSYRPGQWEREFSDPRQAVASGLIPTTALRSASDFFAWRDRAVRAPEGIDEALENRLTEVYRDRLSGLHRYDIPAVIIDSSVDPAAIARIFERVNRTGLTLGTFDLVVARSFTKSFNLRERWETACSANPELSDFLGKDGLPILTLIALRDKRDVRQSAILSLTGEAVRDQWGAALASIIEAIAVLRREYGVPEISWLPNQYMLTVLAALHMEGWDLAQNPELQSWYWYTGLTGTYDVASNTRSVSDYRRLTRQQWRLPRRIVLVREHTVTSTRKESGSFHRAFLNLAIASNPRSIVDGRQYEAVDELAAMSVFDKDASRQAATSPYHLRTLSMIVRGRSERPKTVLESLRGADRSVLISQLTPTEVDLSSADRWLERRLELVVHKLEDEVGLRFRIVSEFESDEWAAGTERFNMLQDLLHNRGHGDLADVVEFVDWSSDRQELVVSTPDEERAAMLIGTDGRYVKGLVAEMPVSWIQVEVVPS